MWNITRVTEILGIEYPIIQGPFGGGVSSDRLVAAVSNAGGMGGYGAHYMEPDAIGEIDAQIRRLTDKPYALNLWVSDVDERVMHYHAADHKRTADVFKPFFDELNIPVPQLAKAESRYDKQVEKLLELRPPVFSFVFGIPSAEVLKECRKLGIKTIGAATTLDEALALEEANVDLIVASGFEAGGHRPSFLRPAEDSLTGTFVLIQQIVSKVKTPVIAAGGIADAKGIVAALTLGASAVQIGTAFLACEESNATEQHREKIFSPGSEYSTLTTAITGRMARGIRGGISDFGSAHKEIIAPFPLQSYFISVLTKAAAAQGRTDLLTYWAGQIAPVVKHRNVNSLMQSLVEDTGSFYRK
jgi:nitronate monooxygenase